MYSVDFCILVLSPLLHDAPSVVFMLFIINQQSQDDVRLDPALQFILFFVSCFLSIYFFICFVCFSRYFCLRTFIMLFNNSCTYLISESFLILKLSFPLFPLSCCFNSCISTPKCHVSARILSWMDL